MKVFYLDVNGLIGKVSLVAFEVKRTTPKMYFVHQPLVIIGGRIYLRQIHKEDKHVFTDLAVAITATNRFLRIFTERHQRQMNDLITQHSFLNELGDEWEATVKTKQREEVETYLPLRLA